MAKRKFTSAQRYAVYAVHGEKCYLCGTWVDVRTYEIDHVIPESLQAEPEKLAAVIAAFDLGDDFKIDSFENWLPACGPCNSKKRSHVFSPTPIVQVELNKAREKSAEVLLRAQEVVNVQALSRAVNSLYRAVESNYLPDTIADDIKKLVMFHSERRLPALVAQPIRFSPEFQVAMEVEFTGGGPRNGEIVTSGSDDLCSDAARWMLMTMIPAVARVEKGSQKPGKYFTWKDACKDLVDLARDRKWTEAERKARIRHHVYDITDYEWTATALRFKAQYEGID